MVEGDLSLTLFRFSHSYFYANCVMLIFSQVVNYEIQLDQARSGCLMPCEPPNAPLPCGNGKKEASGG